MLIYCFNIISKLLISQHFSLGKKTKRTRKITAFRISIARFVPFRNKNNFRFYTKNANHAVLKYKKVFVFK